METRTPGSARGPQIRTGGNTSTARRADSTSAKLKLSQISAQESVPTSAFRPRVRRCRRPAARSIRDP